MLDGYCNGSGVAYAYAKLIDERCKYECIKLVKTYLEVEHAPYKSWEEDEGGYKRHCEEFYGDYAETIKPVADDEFEVFDIIRNVYEENKDEHIKIKEILEIEYNFIEPDLDTFVDENWETYMETKVEEQMEKQWLERQGKQ